MTLSLACLTVKQHTESKYCSRITNMRCTPLNKHKIAVKIDNDKSLVQADDITTLAKGYLA